MTTILCKTCSPRKGCFVYQNGGNRIECKFYQPLTNEEYIRSCSTEELAELIFEIAVTDKLMDRFFNAEVVNENAMKNSGVEEAEIWLKEKHHE